MMLGNSQFPHVHQNLKFLIPMNWSNDVMCGSNAPTFNVWLTPIYKPWISAIWKGKQPNTQVLGTYPRWEDPPSMGVVDVFGGF